MRYQIEFVPSALQQLHVGDRKDVYENTAATQPGAKVALLTADNMVLSGHLSGQIQPEM
jgi:hypothetical protein